MNAKELKDNGFSHVLLEIINNGNVWDITTINKAIKKGY